MSYEFKCRYLDHPCRWHAEAATEEALLAEIALHVQAEHAVATPSETIVEYVKTKIRRR